MNERFSTIYSHRMSLNNAEGNRRSRCSIPTSRLTLYVIFTLTVCVTNDLWAFPNFPTFSNFQQKNSAKIYLKNKIPRSHYLAVIQTAPKDTDYIFVAALLFKESTYATNTKPRYEKRWYKRLKGKYGATKARRAAYSYGGAQVMGLHYVEAGVELPDVSNGYHVELRKNYKLMFRLLKRFERKCAKKREGLDLIHCKARLYNGSSAYADDFLNKYIEISEDI